MEWFFRVFDFSSSTAMNFVQMDFWILFVVVYSVFAIIHKEIKTRNIFLIFASLFFYYKTSGLFVFLLILSVIIDFYLAKAIFKSQQKQRKLSILVCSVLLNLLVLSYFKYAYFFVDVINYFFDTDFKVVNYFSVLGNYVLEKDYFSADTIILPVGISFYTFQKISYTVDLYRNKIEPLNSITDFGFFVTFFPQLVAGPIVRASDFISQIKAPTKVSVQDFNIGSFLILKGLLKKIVFSDFLANEFLDRVFEAPTMFSGFANIMALVGYSLQIYADFSGYVDIALGISLFMGFHLPRNFNSPYKATSCGNFWSRWHISLSTWLKDYLYIPLGGNRECSKASIFFGILFLMVFLLVVHSPLMYIITGFLIVGGTVLSLYNSNFKKKITTNINLLLTMLIGGLWHGASWKFIVWGGLNGLGVIFSKHWKKISPYENSTHWLARFWKIFFTFCFIVFVRLYFRGEDELRISQWYDQVIHNMNISSAFEVISYFKWAFLVMTIGYTILWLPTSLREKVENLWNNSSIYVKAFVSMAVIIICIQAYSSEYQPFIYFQF